MACEAGLTVGGACKRTCHQQQGAWCLFQDLRLGNVGDEKLESRLQSKFTAFARKVRVREYGVGSSESGEWR